MRLYKYIFVFLGFYLFFLFLFLPVDMLWPYLGVNRVAGLRPVLVQGNWRHGRLRGLSTPLLRVDTFTWDLDPLALIEGRLRVDFSLVSAAGKLAGVISLSSGGISVSRVSGRLAAAGFRSPMPLSGEFIFAKVNMILRNGRVNSAGGDLQWRSAGFGPYSALGDLRMTLGSGDGGINARIRGERGLDLAAELRLFADGRVRIRGTARPTPDQAAIFAFIGRTGPDGRVKIDYHGRVRK